MSKISILNFLLLSGYPNIFRIITKDKDNLSSVNSNQQYYNNNLEDISLEYQEKLYLKEIDINSSKNKIFGITARVANRRKYAVPRITFKIVITSHGNITDKRKGVNTGKECSSYVGTHKKILEQNLDKCLQTINDKDFLLRINNDIHRENGSKKTYCLFVNYLFRYFNRIKYTKGLGQEYYFIPKNRVYLYRYNCGGNKFKPLS